MPLISLKDTGIYMYEEWALQNLGRSGTEDKGVCERFVESSVNRRAASHTQSAPNFYEHFVIRPKLGYSEKCQWICPSGFPKIAQGKEEKEEGKPNNQ